VRITVYARAVITIRAKKAACKLKKIMLQEKFKTKLIAYRTIAFFVDSGFFSLSIYIIAELTPIRIKSTDHTIGKTIAGGDKGGDFNSPYTSILSFVSAAEIMPTVIGMAIAME
jgi:hypothetical protein